MFLSPQELKSVLYQYQLDEITENDPDIVLDAIMSAVEEVKSYFEASNERRYALDLNVQQFNRYKIYDIEAIFEAQGDDRNRLVLRLCKTIAAWYVCELSNVDAIYKQVRERYENCIIILERIAGMGRYADCQMFISGLPSPLPDNSGENSDDSANAPKPFRAGSRQKFNHEPN
jgi:hypothetical protein